MLATPWFDPGSGWFCMGEKERALNAEAVEFATGCVAVVVGGRLASLWVKPDNWKELAGECSVWAGSDRHFAL
jgi:kynureninase